MLTAWGRLVYRRRWIVLISSLVLLAVAAAGLVEGGPLSSLTFTDVGTPAQRAQDLLQQEIPAQAPEVGSTFQLMLHDSRCRVQESACRVGLLHAVDPLLRDHSVTSVVTPYSVPPGQSAQLISAAGHTALVVVQVNTSIVAAAAEYPRMVAQVRAAAPAGVTVAGTGQVEVEYALLNQLNGDLGRAEEISLPLSLLLLVVIFGSVVSAFMPLGTGSLAILAGSGAALLLARRFQVTQYAPDVVTLIGLGVSIDYSLFITTRFRDELARGVGTEQAIATALGTAGRAVTFSGLTVAAALCSLLFFAGTLAPSAGIAGAFAVIAAVILALTFLPAVLSLLGPRIDTLRLPLRAGGRSRERIWRWLGIRVMRRPLRFLLPTMAALILAGLPFMNVRMAAAGIDQLPPQNPARLHNAALMREFPAQRVNAIPVVVDYRRGNPLTPGRVKALYGLSRRLARLPGVEGVSGPLDIAPQLTRAEYVRLLTAPVSAQPSSVRSLLQSTVGRHIVVMNVRTADGVTSPAAQSLVADLRQETIPGGSVMISGQTALDEDVVQYIVDRLPYAVGSVVLVTLLLLFLLTHSVVIPFKAVLSNAVSICASFGALVWIFQEGHLARFLDFTPQPIDPSVLVLLFAAVFGLSMDYEVLLVSRIQEAYLRTGNNCYATARGLQRSGALITGAAAIMIAVFAAFTSADLMILKSIGLGLAIAIGIDATLVRGIVVPSVMRLLGPLNWWAPAPLHRLLPRISWEESDRGGGRGGSGGGRTLPEYLPILVRAVVRSLVPNAVQLYRRIQPRQPWSFARRRGRVRVPLGFGLRGLSRPVAATVVAALVCIIASPNLYTRWQDTPTSARRAATPPPAASRTGGVRPTAHPPLAPAPGPPAPGGTPASATQVPAAAQAPTSTAPVSAAPVSAAPVSAAPVSAAPVSAAPVSAAPVSAAPVLTPPVSTASSSTPPVSTASSSTPPSSTRAVSAPPLSAPPLSATARAPVAAAAPAQGPVVVPAVAPHPAYPAASSPRPAPVPLSDDGPRGFVPSRGDCRCGGGPSEFGGGAGEVALH